LEHQWTTNKRIECGYIVYKFNDVWCHNSKNGHIQPIISEHAGPILTNYSSLIDIWVG